MSVKIRLRRMGRNKTPFFRVVVTDSRCPADGRFLETIGWYDPMKKDGEDCVVDMERLGYWKQQGAQVTDTVRNLVNKLIRRKPFTVQAGSQAEQAAEAAPAETAQA